MTNFKTPSHIPFMWMSYMYAPSSITHMKDITHFLVQCFATDFFVRIFWTSYSYFFSCFLYHELLVYFVVFHSFVDINICWVIFLSPFIDRIYIDSVYINWYQMETKTYSYKSSFKFWYYRSKNLKIFLNCFNWDQKTSITD